MGPTFQYGLNKWNFRTLNKIASKSGLKSSNIEKQSFSTKIDIFLIYKSQNAYLPSSNLPLVKQNISIEAARTPGFINGFLYATIATILNMPLVPLECVLNDLEVNSSNLIGEYGIILRGPKLGPLFKPIIMSPC